MSTKTSPRVTVSESMHVRAKEIGEYILHQMPNLVLASCAGFEPFGPHETDSYALMPATVKGLLETTGLVDVSKPIWATLWFSNSIRGADFKHWVMEVYGRRYLAPFTELANELAEKFDVNIHVRLSSESERGTSLFGL